MTTSRAPTSRRSATPPRLADCDRDRLAGPLGAARARSTRPTRSGRWPRASTGSRSGRKLYVMDMFPYPSGAGPARRPPAGLHRHRRLRAVPADGRAQRAAHHGLRRLRAARRAVRGADRAAPAGHDRGQHRDLPPQLRRLGLGHDERRRRRHDRPGVLPLDAVDLPADLQLLVRPDADKARPIAELVAELDAGTREPATGTNPFGRPWAGAVRRRAPRRSSTTTGWPIVHESTVNWAPGWAPCCPTRRSPPTAAVERGNFPVFRAAAAAVDAADHRVRRPADRRPGRDRLAGVDQADAAQLDRPLDRRARRLPSRRRADRGLHHPAGHAVRRDLHGAGARASAGRRADRRRAGPTAIPAVDGRRGHSGARRSTRYRTCGGRRSELDRQTEGRQKTGVFTGSYADQPGHRRRGSRSSSPTTS